MTNIPHSSLTGADLHESKGVAAAAASTIFVADGAGSGSFQKLPATAISGLANPFGASLFHVREEQASGTHGATSGAVNGWVQVALNTIKTNEIPGASLSSNDFTLPIGTYFIDAIIPYVLAPTTSQACSLRAALRNLTTATFLHFSQWAQFSVGGVAGVVRTEQGFVGLRGRFTLAATSVLELQQWRIDTNNNTVFASSLGTEVYAEALIWKVS
jgi:hypothetical protein